jgi:uncharacterized RDD family membrane protein YckC
MSRFTSFIDLAPKVDAAHHDSWVLRSVGSSPIEYIVALPSRFHSVSVELPGQVAGLGRRLAAITIDWFACLFIAKLAAPALQLGEVPFLPLTIFFLEVTIFTWFFAASFGQRLLAVEVMAIDGQRLMLWRIALRTLLICLVLPAVIYDSQGRGLHDRAVGSVAMLRKKTN